MAALIAKLLTHIDRQITHPPPYQRWYSPTAIATGRDTSSPTAILTHIVPTGHGQIPYPPTILLKDDAVVFKTGEDLRPFEEVKDKCVAHCPGPFRPFLDQAVKQVIRGYTLTGRTDRHPITLSDPGPTAAHTTTNTHKHTRTCVCTRMHTSTRARAHMCARAHTYTLPLAPHESCACTRKSHSPSHVRALYVRLVMIDDAAAVRFPGQRLQIGHPTKSKGLVQRTTRQLLGSLGEVTALANPPRPKHGRCIRAGWFMYK